MEKTYTVRTKVSLLIFASILLAFIIPLKTLAASMIAIKAPVANIYAEPTDGSSIVTQAIYGSIVTPVQNKNDFTLINTDDDYSGWVKKDAIGKQDITNNGIVKVKNLFAYVYKEPRYVLYTPLFMIPFGSVLPIIQVKNDEWIQVQLVDGGSGWISHGDVDINPKPLTMQEMLDSSHKFVGLSYLWAGTSTFGADCSGFVQLLYRQIGIILPRDANLQVNWHRFIEVKREDLHPGDVMFFGWNNVISHAGVYLGDNKFINSTAFQSPTISISDLRTPHWRDLFIAARRLDPNWEKTPEFNGKIESLPEETLQKMEQYTWHKGCPVPHSDLAYLRLSYWGFDDKPHHGALIVHKNLASQVLEIFKELYALRFPIENMKTIEEYNGDDALSMKDNNTSAFNCRAMSDFHDKYSIHSYGAAIDINPLINPYINGNKVSPKEGSKYSDRAAFHKGKITLNSAIYKIFIKHGWTWGGNWNGALKDYQHFEKLNLN